MFFSEYETYVMPAYPTANVVDPTGAGDSFAGGMMGYLASTGDASYENLKKSIIFGSALASFCVEEFAISRLKSLSRDEIESRVQQFRDLVHF